MSVAASAFIEKKRSRARLKPEHKEIKKEIKTKSALMGAFFVVWGIDSGGGRRGLLIENPVGFQHGLSRASGLSVIRRFCYAGQSPDDE